MKLDLYKYNVDNRKQERLNKMKKVFFTICLIAVISFIGIQANKHYKNYQQKQNVSEQNLISETEKLKNQISKLEVSNQVIKNKNKQLLAECKKGMIAYAKLTPLQKTQTETLLCSE